VTQRNKQDSNVRDLSKPEKRNARFEQEVADSRDHDKQSGKDIQQKNQPAAPAPKKH
jgi:hypothetical protein